jgi:hypothetical protein
MFVRLCLFVGIVLLLCPVGSGRSVSVDVDAPWPRALPSAIAEVGEFVKEHAPAHYWTYVDALCDQVWLAVGLIPRSI